MQPEDAVNESIKLIRIIRDWDQSLEMHLFSSSVVPIVLSTEDSLNTEA